MRLITTYMAAMALGLMLCALSGCNPTSILGPKDKPNFKAMQWQEMKVSYWVSRGKGPSHLRWHRNLTISNAEALLKLRDLLSVSETGPNSLGAGKDIIITMADGKVWQGDFSAYGTRFDLCKSEANYYSYILKLSDNKLYKRIKQLCLEHEKRNNPSATIEDISFWVD